MVFAGYLDRRFIAYDSKTGKELWEVRLNDTPNASPITYEANGEQYLAIVAGDGGPLVGGLAQLVPEIKSSASRATTLWVFSVAHSSAGVRSPLGR